MIDDTKVKWVITTKTVKQVKIWVALSICFSDFWHVILSMIFFTDLSVEGTSYFSFMLIMISRPTINTFIFLKKFLFAFICSECIVVLHKNWCWFLRKHQFSFDAMTEMCTCILKYLALQANIPCIFWIQGQFPYTRM